MADHDQYQMEACTLFAELVIRRHTLGISQREVARRMDVCQASISHYENGITQISVPMLVAYATAVDAKIRVDIPESPPP